MSYNVVYNYPERGDDMPTNVVNIRMDEDLLNYLKQRAEKEHRTLSNMIISILLTEKERDESEL